MAAAALWAAPTLASEPAVDTSRPLAQVCNDRGACSYDFAVIIGGTVYGWSGVAIQDTACDGNSVHTDYYRDDNQYRRLDHHGGCGTEGRTGYDINNRVDRHRACTNINLAPDPCSSYVYR